MASRKPRLVLYASLVVGGVVLLVAILLLVRLGNRAAYNARFRAHVDDYLAVSKEQTEQGPYLRGKVVVIDRKEKSVDREILDGIPSELHASGPDDLGTVVLLEWGRQVGPVYTNGAIGMIHTCEVAIVDNSIPAIVGRRGFRGSDPPSETHGRGEIFGDRPVKAVIDFLTGLPREAKEAGPAPEGWFVLFRSDDPAVWNTDSPAPRFAVPIRRAHPSIRHLRLTRVDSSEKVILPITYQQLLREEKPEPAAGVWWNGTAKSDWGGAHLGVCQVPPTLTGRAGAIRVSNHDFFTGSGFGHKIRVDDKQYWCWQGREIARTAFEIAVTADKLSEADRRFLLTPDPDEGPAPRGWTVLFRSDDPSVWNTDSPAPRFAMPACRAHSRVRYLRLKRMDTGEMLILPITRDQLLQQPRPPGENEQGWNGTAKDEYGGCHLGIIQGPRTGQREVIAVMNEGGPFLGSGFGHKVHVDDRQYCCWQGKEIARTAFEIAVTADPLSEEEKRFLSVPGTTEKLPPSIGPGSPVPGAIAQPELPPELAGNKAVDLVALVDPGKDALLGRWLVHKNALHCNDMHGVPRIRIPYQPPGEYDLVVTFSQPALRNGISLVMPNPAGGAFFWAVGHSGGRGGGFHGKAGKEITLPTPLVPNRAYTTTVQVRRDGVKALLDGKVIAEYRGDFHDLGSDGYRDLKDPSLLGVACDDPTVFHYVRVIEVTGTGKKTR